MNYIVYNMVGEILRTGQAPADMVSIQAGEGETAVEGVADTEMDYVLGGAILPRPVCPATLEDGSLHSLPTPCTLVINDAPYQCDEDAVDFEFTNPGLYKIKVTSWPYLDAHFEVIV